MFPQSPRPLRRFVAHEISLYEDALLDRIDLETGSAALFRNQPPTNLDDCILDLFDALIRGQLLSQYLSGKGYSICVPLDESNERYAPRVSLTDDANKLVFSNLETHFRIAGTAELDGWNTSLPYHRISGSTPVMGPFGWTMGMGTAEMVVKMMGESGSEGGGFERRSRFSGAPNRLEASKTR